MDVKPKVLALVAEIDADELAVRLMAIGVGAYPTALETRTARQIIADSKASWPAGFGPFPFDRMAAAAIEFMASCIQEANRPN